MPLINGAAHQHLLQDIVKSERMDRPDILHLGLLTALGYRTYFPDLKLFFSIEKKDYEVNSETNLPRSQIRFYGLIEQLLNSKKENPFIMETNMQINDDPIIVFSKKGEDPNWDEIVKYDTFGFGGFAFGDPKTNFNNQILVKLSEDSLDLWTSISRFLNLYNIHKFKK